MRGCGLRVCDTLGSSEPEPQIRPNADSDFKLPVPSNAPKVLLKSTHFKSGKTPQTLKTNPQAIRVVFDFIKHLPQKEEIILLYSGYHSIPKYNTTHQFWHHLAGCVPSGPSLQGEQEHD